MHLQAHQAIHHVNAVFFQLARPLDVALLVEARFQFQQHRDLLAVLRRVDQRIHDRRITANPVQRDFDGQDVGIARRLLQQPDHRLERIERMVQQNVAALDGREDLLFLAVFHQRRRHRRNKRGELQVRPIELGQDPHTHQR